MAIFSTKRTQELHPDDVRMTLGEHLEELRTRVVRALIGLAVGAAVAFAFIDYIMAFLTSSVYTVLAAQGQPPVMKSYSPAENFVTDLKVSLVVGLLVSAPYSLAQIWSFIAAGLYPKERRWVNRFAPVSIALFFTGAIFLLVVVSPLLLNFLISYRTEYPDIGRFLPHWLVPNVAEIAVSDTQANQQRWSTTHPIPSFESDPEEPPEGVPWLNRTDREIRIRLGSDRYSLAYLKKVTKGKLVTPEMRVSEFIPFILQLAAAFGIGFQVPVVVTFLAAVGIAQAKDMARLRRYVIFAMAIGSAVITPPDPGSMVMLLLPMALLYEAGLFVARIIERNREQPAA